MRMKEDRIVKRDDKEIKERLERGRRSRNHEYMVQVHKRLVVRVAARATVDSAEPSSRIAVDPESARRHSRTGATGLEDAMFAQAKASHLQQAQKCTQNRAST